MDQISWIFYAAVFVAMAFGIANVLFMAVYERMREFGIMRAGSS
jgi:ABC-type antimicrobial peptide transport system permease subunit